MYLFAKRRRQMNNEMESLLRERINRVAYTHIIHEKNADIINFWIGVLKWTQIIISAAITCELFGLFFNDERWLKIVAVISSFILTSITMITKKLGLDQKAEKHKTYAARYLNLKDALIALLADAKGMSLNDSDVAKRRDELKKEYDELNKHAPRTCSRAYSKAEKTIKKGMRTSNDSVTDIFLPEKLRIVNTK